MPLPEATVPDSLANQAAGLTCEEQYHLCKRIAANLGYRLVPGDSLQSAEDWGDIRERLRRLESAVHDLNPGWLP